MSGGGKLRRKRLNVRRRAGRFEFLRESGRYSDGTPDGREILYVRIKGVAAAYASTPYPESTGLCARTSYNAGHYFSAAGPVMAAKEFRRYLLARLEAEA